MKYKEEEQKGKILKPCPGQKGYLCCGLYVVETALGCPYPCDYCALQSYIEKENIIFYKGIEKLKKEIKKFKDIRITTGQFSDSLATENFYPYLEKIYEIIEGEKITLELKTKSTNIKPILKLKSKRQIICGFSLNSMEVWKEFERKTPSPLRRIEAAKKLQEEDFYLSFHFDPLIYGYHYDEIIQNLTEKIKEEKVLWISLGVFRYPERAFLEILKNNEKLLKGEYFQSKDGKYRLYRPLREKIYINFLKKLREKWKNVFVYFCMENQLVWKNVLGIEMSDQKLKKILDEKAKLVL